MPGSKRVEIYDLTLSRPCGDRRKGRELFIGFACGHDSRSRNGANGEIRSTQGNRTWSFS
jgi:hypothetical protein